MKNLFAIKAASFFILTNILFHIASIAQDCNRVFVPSEGEINCFRHFDAKATGRNDVNAYLLSYINWLMYPERLSFNMKLDNGDALKDCSKKLHEEGDNFFEPRFKDRFEHMLWNPTPPKSPKPPSAVTVTPTAGNATTGTTISSAGVCGLTITASQDHAIDYPEQDVRWKITNPFMPVSKVPKQDFSNILVNPNCTSQWAAALSDYAASYAVYEKQYSNYVNEFEYWKKTKPYIQFLNRQLNIGLLPGGDIFSWDPEVMIISTRDFIIICFRGTDRVKSKNGMTYTWGEWFGTNAFIPTLPNPNIGGAAHLGMTMSFNLIVNDIINELRAFNPDKSKPVWITGHSLGGGLSVLLANHISYKGLGYNTRTYVYESPRVVGNQEFNRWISTEKVPAYSVPQRFEFRYDPLPVIGEVWGTPYKVFGKRNYISDEGLNKYSYNCPERTPLELFNMQVCDHNPEWVTRGLYYAVSDIYKKSLPATPPYPQPATNKSIEACGTFIGFEPGDGVYYIKSAAKNTKALNVPPGKAGEVQLICRRMILWDWSNSYSNERFKIERDNGGGYKIRTMYENSDMVIDMDCPNGKTIPGSGTCDQNGVELKLCKNAIPWDHQLWFFDKMEDGTYVIYSKSNGYAIDAANELANDSKIYATPRKLGDMTQRWILEKVQ